VFFLRFFENLQIQNVCNVQLFLFPSTSCKVTDHGVGVGVRGKAISLFASHYISWISMGLCHRRAVNGKNGGYTAEAV